jgi:rare lipoprotein A
VTNGAEAGPPAEPRPSPVRLYLQAGAFSDRLNAERLSQRLWPVAGKLVYVSPTIVDGTALYRVRIGPLPDVVKADQLTSRIIAMEMEAPRIVLE